jgi:hypothetical protein
VTYERYNALVGEVYVVRTEFLRSGDPRRTRPAVVIQRAAGPYGRLRIVTRTRDARRIGVPHGPAPDLQLKDPGKFTDLYTVDAVQFHTGHAVFVGVLDADTLDLILEWFE